MEFNEPKRAYRRRMRERVINKYHKDMLNRYSFDGSYHWSPYEYEDWEHHSNELLDWAKKKWKHAKKPCECCQNPRNSGWEKKTKLTIQERKNEKSFLEALEELNEDYSETDTTT